MVATKHQDLTADTRQRLPGSFTELTAGVTHYETRGNPDGACVVLIHGNAAPYVTWDNTIDDLCEAGFLVLRYDVFGHGFSDRPKLRRYDRRLYNKQLEELLDDLGIGSPIRVVGTSQGGSIGACFAAEHPGTVERLALLSPLFDDFVGSRGVVPSLLKAPLVGELLLRMVRDHRLTDLSASIISADTRATLEDKAAVQYRYEGKRRAMLANWRGGGLDDATSCYVRVRDQGIPTLLTWGERDTKIPGDSMQRLRELLPDIEYHEIGGAGHLAHYEFPERLNPPLIRFLIR